MTGHPSGRSRMLCAERLQARTARKSRQACTTISTGPSSARSTCFPISARVRARTRRSIPSPDRQQFPPAQDQAGGRDDRHDSASALLRCSLNANDTNRPISVRIAAFLRFRDGKLACLRAVIDTFDLVEQRSADRFICRRWPSSPIGPRPANEAAPPVGVQSDAARSSMAGLFLAHLPKRSYRSIITVCARGAARIRDTM